MSLSTLSPSSHSTLGSSNGDIQADSLRKRKLAGSQALPTGPPEKVQVMSTDDNKQSETTCARCVRDDAYYFEDGSCIILVQNTLFNVGSACVTMYSILIRS